MNSTVKEDSDEEDWTNKQTQAGPMPTSLHECSRNNNNNKDNNVMLTFGALIN